MCPRCALKRAVVAWEAKGLTPKVGIGLEAFAFVHDESGKLVPYNSLGAVVYGTGPFTDGNGDKALSTGGKGGPEHLADLARGCFAGLLHHHKGLAGLIAPTANSYDRLQPGSLSGHWQNWGGDHRNVTTRFSSEGGAKARLEHRMADASAKPLHGLVRRRWGGAGRKPYFHERGRSCKD